MAPLQIAAWIAAAAVGASAAGHWQSRRNDSAATALGARLEAIRLEIAAEKGRHAEETQLAETLAARREELNRTLAGAAQGYESPPLDPEKEGLFPEGKPYFYLHKGQLANVQFEPFTEEHLSPVSAILFGMDDGERQRLADAFAAFCARMQDIEAARFEKPERPFAMPGNASRLIIGKLPVLAAETAPLLDQFRSDAEMILGTERTDLFFTHAGHHFRTEMDDLGAHERWFTVPADSSPAAWTMNVCYAEDGAMRTLDKTAYGPGWPQNFRFKHLFGPGAPGDIHAGRPTAPAAEADASHQTSTLPR